MQKYNERFNDIVILQLETEGFENLTQKQKNLAFHLSKAGLWGRIISLEQGSEYNVPLFDALITLYSRIRTVEHPLYKEVHDTLFTMFAHNGIYDSTSGEKLNFPLQYSTLCRYAFTEPMLVDTIKDILFSDKIPQFRTVQTDGIDVVKESGGNFYKNLTTEEVKQFRKDNYPKITLVLKI